MHDAGFMCRGQRVGDLTRDIQSFAKLQRSPGHALAQRLTLNELGGNKVCVVRFPDFVDGKYVRVV